jgi:uncharacterized protein YjbI with pentapeptide repeats
MSPSPFFCPSRRDSLGRFDAAASLTNFTEVNFTEVNFTVVNFTEVNFIAVNLTVVNLTVAKFHRAPS